MHNYKNSACACTHAGIDNKRNGDDTMKITIVGMWNSFPKNNEATSGYLLEKDGFTVLIDTGSGIAAHVQDYIGIHDIHHIILTHYHHDHAADVAAFMLARRLAGRFNHRSQHLNLYGPDSGAAVKLLKQAKYSNFHTIRKNSKFEIGPFKFDFHRTAHPVETYAVRAVDDSGSTLVYTSDSSYNAGLIRFAFGADLLLTDCSFYEGFDARSEGHMNAGEAGRLAAKSDAGLTILTNLPHRGALEALLDSAKQHGKEEIQLAEAGMVLNI